MDSVCLSQIDILFQKVSMGDLVYVKICFETLR